MPLEIERVRQSFPYKRIIERLPPCVEYQAKSATTLDSGTKGALRQPTALAGRNVEGRQPVAGVVLGPHVNQPGTQGLAGDGALRWHS